MKEESLFWGAVAALVLGTAVAETPPQSVLNAQRPMSPVGVASDAAGFALKLTADLSNVKAREVLLELPGAAEVFVRQAGTDPAQRGFDGRQNYLNFRCEDGSCPVLEARIALHSQEHPEWNTMTVGVPLSRLARSEGTHEIELRFAGARWQMRVDELYDEDFPFGRVLWETNTVWALKSPRVTSAALRTPPPADAPRPLSRPIPHAQYFTPEGHNAWVGDVAVGFHNGRYHVFYLIDRRHHRSKFGQGGHYFAHLSSPDLKHWFEHPPAADLDEQWETLGTGTPFVYRDKLCLSYGLHTTRLFPREKTMLPEMQAYFQKTGRFGVFACANSSAVPAGMTYAVSDDDIQFRKSQVMVHLSENPTIYGQPDGTLILYGGYGAAGLWQATSLPGEWTCVDTLFPPKSSMEPTTECQCAFNWNGRHYLMGGFTGLWCSPSGKGGTYVDLAGEGRDVYDGLGVPMVAEFTGNRRILAGWLGGQGWGGHLVLRELVQYEDGTLGMKWPEEAVPPCGGNRTTPEGASFDLPPSGRALLSFTIGPGAGTNGVFALRLSGADGKSGCELQLDVLRGRAQWNDAVADGVAAVLPTGREIMEAKHAGEAWAGKGCAHPNFHRQGRNFSIENVRGMDPPFTLRVIVFRDPKMGGSVVDAEIAGQRTLVSCRPGLWAKSAVVASGIEGVRVSRVEVCGWAAEGASLPSVEEAVDAAHANLWKRFISADGILYDYVGELPTPEDCRLGKPNAIGWNSPIENGPMFTGLYLPAVCERARRSGLPSDREQAHRLAKGLVKCASASNVPGFIARGFGADGLCHYPLGSDDQTIPWFYGLHAYVKSGLPQGDELQRVVDKMREVADVLEATDWRCPCDGAFKGQFRCEFKRGLPFRSAVHYLFILRAMYDVTGDKIWFERYVRERDAQFEGTNKTRLEICATGYEADLSGFKNLESELLWIYIAAQGSLSQLAEMETDDRVRAYYRKGLVLNAGRASRLIGAYQRFNNLNTEPFGYADWREGYRWEPQKTQADAARVASTGRKEVLGDQKDYERSTVTNPLTAAAIVALAGGAGPVREEIERALRYYDYSKINLCEFFWQKSPITPCRVRAFKEKTDEMDNDGFDRRDMRRVLCGRGRFAGIGVHAERAQRLGLLVREKRRHLPRLLPRISRQRGYA